MLFVRLLSYSPIHLCWCDNFLICLPIKKLSQKQLLIDSKPPSGLSKLFVQNVLYLLKYSESTFRQVWCYWNCCTCNLIHQAKIFFIRKLRCSLINFRLSCHTSNFSKELCIHVGMYWFSLTVINIYGCYLLQTRKLSWFIV